MGIISIRNARDHKAALRGIDKLLAVKKLTEEQSRRLDALTILVDAYEEKAFPMGGLDPIDLIKAPMSNSGRTQKDLADLIGSARLAHLEPAARSLARGDPQDQRGLGRSGRPADQALCADGEAGLDRSLLTRSRGARRWKRGNGRDRRRLPPDLRTVRPQSIRAYAVWGRQSPVRTSLQEYRILARVPGGERPAGALTRHRASGQRGHRHRRRRPPALHRSALHALRIVLGRDRLLQVVALSQLLHLGFELLVLHPNLQIVK